MPVHDPTAERAVLGSMLRDNGVIDEVVLILRKEHFYADAHQTVFDGIVALYHSGRPSDLVTMGNLLRDQNQIDNIGGYAYLGELWDASPTAANAKHYAEIVLEKYLAREAMRLGGEVVQDASQGRPTQELLREANEQILKLAEEGTAGQVKPLSEGLRLACDEIDQWHASSQEGITGLATGFVDLDELTCGLRKSELIVLAARPSIGKTALALNMTRHIAVEQNLPLFFASLEQSQTELAHRLLCCQGRVDGRHVRAGCLNREEKVRLPEAREILDRAKVFVDDQASQDMLRICANARLLKQRHDIAAIFLDYLQLVSPENRRAPRQEQVAATTRRLKVLARELAIPVVALSQLNRKPEERADDRPMLSDLRESGAIEQDADTVLLLYHQGDDATTAAVRTGVIVAKQRSGPTGEITLVFSKSLMRFENYAAEYSYRKSRER
jgi:replicative DNA helicase